MNKNINQPCGATCTDEECQVCNDNECNGDCVCLREENQALSDAEEKAIANYNTLSKIIEQLEMCDYECPGGNLKNNIAFIALKRMSEKEGK